MLELISAHDETSINKCVKGICLSLSEAGRPQPEVDYVNRFKAHALEAGNYRQQPAILTLTGVLVAKGNAADLYWVRHASSTGIYM